MKEFFCIVIITLIPFSHLFSAIIDIPEDYPTIQAGILSSSDHDTVLVQPGVYSENINFLGHKVVLASLYFMTNDSTYIESTIIDGGSAGSVVSFHNREDSTTIICGFTLTNGSSTSGGGIYCQNSSPVIEHNKISGNFSDAGGGIYCTNSSAKIIGNFISENSINSPLGNPGGGIFCSNGSNCVIMENIITENLNQDGAGIACYNSNPVITRNIIYNNTALDLGGGFRIDDCSPTIINNTIWGNSASSGGGMCINSSSNSVITNNILWNNTASIGQDEIQLNGGTPQITYCDVQGGWAGTVNLNINPMLIDPNHGLFQLQASSPCIDAGDPNFPLDPDSTISDIGAFYFDQNFQLPVIEDFVIILEGDDVCLQWTPIASVSSYNIYRAETPYFEITGMTPAAVVTEPQYIDSGAAGEGDYFYVVTCMIE